MAYGLVVEGGHPVVIFDPEKIRGLPPALAHDMPAGGPRVISRSAATKAVVSGRVLIEDGAPTAAAPPWPGRLLRRFEE